MLEFKTGDLFTEDVEALVNSVNCVGVMGRGIALQFKNNFPKNFEAYRKACDQDRVQPGEMFVFESPALGNPRYIINFPTKRHWRSKSRMVDLETGLAALANEIRSRDIRSLAMPALATDLGGLQWSDVRPAIEAALTDLDDVHVTVFEPGSVPKDGRPNRSQAVPAMTETRAILIGLIDRYLRGLLDPYITLLEVHKLMYFAKQAGAPLKLEFQQDRYGPYAPDLRFIMRELEGHYLTGYRDGGDQPLKEIRLIPGAVNDASVFLSSSASSRDAFERVSELVDGFESDFGLELLATVHWLCHAQPGLTGNSLVDETYRWGYQKRKFTRDQVGLAHRHLQSSGWLTKSPPSPPRSDSVAQEKLPGFC